MVTDIGVPSGHEYRNRREDSDDRSAAAPVTHDESPLRN
jgi:hypothetical protein